MLTIEEFNNVREVHAVIYEDIPRKKPQLFTESNV